MDRVKADVPPEARRGGRSTRAQAQHNRERIIAEAATLFREQGFAGVGVAEIMHRVGLTHGGFYGHFATKQELMALACRRAVDDMLADWRARAAAAPGDPLGAIVGPYLSAAHRDRPGTGCLMAALGPEASRGPAPVRRAVTEALAEVLGTLSDALTGADAGPRRARALSIFATLVGALVIARAVDDPALSDEMLATVRTALSGQPLTET